MLSKVKNTASFYIFLLLSFFGVSGVFAAPPAAISYADAVKSGFLEDRTNVDYTEAIHKNRVGNTFFTYMIRKLRSSVAKTTIVRGFEQRAAPHMLTVAAAVSLPGAVDGSIEVTLTSGQADYVTVNDTVQFVMAYDEAGGYTNVGEVISKVNSSVILVKPIEPGKMLGKSVSVGIPINTVAHMTGSIFAQASKSVTPVTVGTTVVENVTQIQRTFYDLAESAAKERLYGGETERSRLRAYAEQVHARKREDTFLFNGKKILIKSSANADKVQKGYAQGMEYTLLKYGTSDEYTTFTYPRFLDWMARIFNPMNIDGTQSSRMVFTNQAGQRYFTDLKASRKWESEKNNDFGVDGVQTIHTDSGTVDLFLHPLVNERYPSLTEPYFMAFHPGYIEYKPYRATKFKAGIQENDYDGMKDEFLTEESYLLFLPELHGVMMKARV